MQPLISIIVPVYKVEQYLDNCVESIVCQTYCNLEIILVDDGSPDNCSSICDAWAAKDGRIKVIHKDNGGLSDARNAGLEVAAGKYIAFVDSDDRIHIEYIQQLYKALIENNADIAACDVRIVQEDEDTLEVDAVDYPVRIDTPEDAIGELICGRGVRAVAWNKLYKSELLRDERYPVGKNHEDEFFTYRILGKAQKIVYVDVPLYDYLQRQGSIMRGFTMKRLDALDAYLERLTYLQKFFPHLYLLDKERFCESCVALYRRALMENNNEAQAIKQKIRDCRKKVRFTIGELRMYSAKKAVYIFASAVSIDLFSRILNGRIGAAYHE